MMKKILISTKQFYKRDVRKRNAPRKMNFWQRKKIVFPFSFFFFENTIKNYFRGYFQRIILVNRESRF